jgi:hypothetical protein
MTLRCPDKPESPGKTLTDSATTRDDLRCPLCEYDLRGLTEPRCPECGYRFAWSDLTDPSKRLHRYLFEHHPERNAWSFAQTLLGGLGPRRFWRSLLPAQPWSVRRLLLYWCLAASMLMAAATAHHAVWSGEYQSKVRAERAIWANRHSSPPWIQWITREYGSMQRYLDEFHPLPPDPRFYERCWAEEGWWSTYLAAAWLAWPWLTFTTLLLFRFSMRRARIKPVHVLRCVLYSFAAVLWLGLVAACAVAARAWWLWNGVPSRVRLPAPPISVAEPFNYRRDLLCEALFWFGLVLLVVVSYRLASAFRHYLRFDHPVASVLCAQLIVLLVAVVVTLNLFVMG